jgi:hypothetical protein
MEIDALEQLISEDVKVQGQIVRDGFRNCLMVFKIITRVVAGVVAGVVVGVLTGGDEVYQHHSSARSSLEESVLTSMRVDHFFLCVEESANLALACVYGFLLESRAIPAMETRLRRRGGMRKPEKGIEGRRRGRAFIKKLWMRKWYDD